MTRRPGLSLTEVLVALFIMGIGCIAILTLFPLGALNMAQAFRDDRCTQCASQARAYLQTYVNDKKSRTPEQLTGEEFHKALTDPGFATVSQYLQQVTVPSYPVVIDPIGYQARGGSDRNPAPPSGRVSWVADNGFGDGAAGTHTSALTRRSLNGITQHGNPPDIAANRVKQLPLAIRSCSLLDGLGYDPVSGMPATVPSGSTIDRDLRYNWLWVVQKLSDGTQVTVVVFDKRAANYAPASVPLETVWVPSTAGVGAATVSFTGSYAANTLPTVQRGGWLLDATLCLLDEKTQQVYPATTGTPPPDARPWVRNANFYRVVSVTENLTGIDVELETPLRPDTRDIKAVEPPLQPGHRRFIYLSGVADVFEKSFEL